MKKITWKLTTCLMAALLLCMPVLTGCDKPEEEPETTLDEVSEGTAEETTEETTKPEDTIEASKGLAFVSNGDGTCCVSRIGKCTDTDVVIPIVSPDGDIVTVISNSAFFGCTNLTSITIPASVTSIETGAFSDCTGLTSITIPDSVTSIGEFTFSHCSNLTSITIPDSVTSIGEGAFAYCSNLTSMVVEVGNQTYHSDGNCVIKTKSKTLIAGCQSSVIPDDGSVTSIGYDAFFGCTGLTSITIPDSVTSIGDLAFDGCTGLTTITIPDSVTSMPTFSLCSNLTSITIPDSVTSIGNSAFFGCAALTDVHYSGTKDQWRAIENRGDNNSLSTATIHCTDGDITPEP